jgi:hypothetical protein
LIEFKNARDAFGGSLLDYTVVPFVTDEANNSDARNPLPALIVGGRKLGMLGGQFVNFSDGLQPHNALWLSVAQAYFPNVNPLELLAQEEFMKRPAMPIDGLWQKPV